MSGNFESKQARNITLEGKQRERKFLFDLGHEMRTSDFFKVSFQFFRFKVT